jgi:hypothetical protein
VWGAAEARGSARERVASCRSSFLSSRRRASGRTPRASRRRGDGSRSSCRLGARSSSRWTGDAALSIRTRSVFGSRRSLHARTSTPIANATGASGSRGPHRCAVGDRRGHRCLLGPVEDDVGTGHPSRMRGTIWVRSARLCAQRLERERELGPRPDAELGVRVGEVTLRCQLARSRGAVPDRRELGACPLRPKTPPRDTNASSPASSPSRACVRSSIATINGPSRASARMTLKDAAATLRTPTEPLSAPPAAARPQGAGAAIREAPR